MLFLTYIIKKGKMDVDEILRKYGRKLESQIEQAPTESYSKEYLTFKKEMAPEISRYERWCQSLGNLVKISLSPKDEV